MPEIGRKDLLRESPALRIPGALSPEEVEARSLVAQENLLSAFPPVAAGRVGIYAARTGEVGTRRIAEAVRKAGGAVFYPRPAPGGAMTFHRVDDESALVPGRFGIPAPGADDPEGEGNARFDLLVVPGIAFDRFGYRLGRGGGYYDRFLARAAVGEAVGLAFSWQVVPELPRDPWDAPVGAVVTELGVIRTAGKIPGRPR